MATIEIITGAQQRVKDSIAVSSTLGLALRSNGEEKVKVIDYAGNVYDASLAAPTVAPVPSNNGGGNLTGSKWIAYAYVYASENKFPFIESIAAIDGSMAPRSNPSPIATLQTPPASQQVNVQVTKTTNGTIDAIWIFRSAYFDTQLEAQTAGEAGLLFYVGKLVNDQTSGTLIYADNAASTGVDQIETDNFGAPQFQFCVYYDPYWWGFGNHTFTETAIWDNTHTGSTGLITLASGQWFNGRDGQLVTLTGVETGGIDGFGTYRFKWLSSTTATVYLTDPTVPVAIAGGSGGGTVIIQGPATTLYHSKPRNPFSWGFTQYIGDAAIPQEYVLKVGGGYGTAIAVVPNEPILKLDTEMPSRCYTLNLRAAGTPQFESSLRVISDTYSVSAHHSQFTAFSEGRMVLWGMDFKNFALLQSNGVSQNPVPSPLPRTLRNLTRDKSSQLMVHGVYDPETEMNCIWIGGRYALAPVNMMIFHHAPSNQWGIVHDHDVLSSASVTDPADGITKTLVGTETGFFGRALTPGLYNNWLPATGLFTGTIASATPNSFTKADVEDFNTTDDGIVGNWVLVTDSNNGTEQIARIANVSADEITVDRVYSYAEGGTTAFNPTPAEGYKFYIGLIECRIMKQYNFKAPSMDKRFLELWLTEQNADPDVAGTLVRFYRENSTQYSEFELTENHSPDGISAVKFSKKVPSELTKFFGLEIINRGYQAWRLYNLTLKAEGVQ